MGIFEVRHIFNRLNEGGHAVPGAEEIESTDVVKISNQIISDIKTVLKLPAIPAGSTGKKKSGDTSGDIDILIQGIRDEKNMNILIDFIRDQYNQKDYSKSGGELHWGYIYKDKNGQTKIAQVDFELVPDLEMGKFVRHSPDFTKDESKWKGMYRTAFLMQLTKYRPLDQDKFPTTEFTEEDKVPDEFVGHKKTYYRMSLMSRGLYLKYKSYVGQRRPVLQHSKVIHEVLLTRNPLKAVKIILGRSADMNTVNSLENLTDYVLSEKYPYRDPETLSKMFYNLCYGDLLFKDNIHEDVKPKREELFEYFMSMMKKHDVKYIAPVKDDDLDDEV